MQQDLLDFYDIYMNTCNAYMLGLGTISFDIATIAPKKGIPYRNKMAAILAGEAFTYESDPQHLQRLKALYEEKELDAVTKKALELLFDRLEDIKTIPKDVYIAFQKCLSDSQLAWEEAISKDDFKVFNPHLQNVILNQKKLFSFAKKKLSPYDQLLNRYQKGMNMDLYDAFFCEIKNCLVPFISTLDKKGSTEDTSLLYATYEIPKQRAFMKVLMKHLLVDPTTCYMSESTHPFSEFFSTFESRITTHYFENNVLSAIFSTIHEFGHAMYNLQIDPRYEGSAIASEISFAMHESQSRFMENHIGRSEAFWKPLYPEFQKIFYPAFQNINLSQFMRMINQVKKSLIRTDADELTYPIHVLIRYEIEKAIFCDHCAIDHLDEMWKAYYKKYLGIVPTSDATGILQDMHWGAGDFGYFPTYALGSAYAAQFFHQIEQDLAVDTLLENGDLTTIYAWLKKHIHQFAAYKSPHEIMIDTTQEAFQPKYYIQYLIDKYSSYYHL